MYAECVVGLRETIGAAHGELKMLDYEPTSIQQPPAMYFLLDSFERVQAGQVVTMTYHIKCCLCIRWQDNERAEREIEPYVNSIPASVSATPYLGFLQAGYASMSGAKSGFKDIAGTTMRIVEFMADVLEKGTIGSGF